MKTFILEEQNISSETWEPVASASDAKQLLLAMIEMFNEDQLNTETFYRVKSVVEVNGKRSVMVLA